jgi:arylsulfatase B
LHIKINTRDNNTSAFAFSLLAGMQHLVILENEPRGLPLTERLLPEYLKDEGYVTRAVGKWHLGFFRKEYLPTNRGFDSHYGYWNGYHDYFSHETQATVSKYLL